MALLLSTLLPNVHPIPSMPRLPIYTFSPQTNLHEIFNGIKLAKEELQLVEAN